MSSNESPDQSGRENDSDFDELDELPRKKGMSGKKLVLFVAGPVLLVGIVAVGLMFSGLLDGDSKEEHAVAEKAEDAKPAVFMDLPEMLVNLNTRGKRPVFLKIVVSLELTGNEDIGHVQSVMPRVIDRFQVYLRELRLDDLRGSAGVYRLREELLARVNTAARPVEVQDVLFKEMLIQ